MIPFLDLRAAYVELKTELDAAVARVLDSGVYILGDEVEAFEREFASYSQASGSVGVGSGLDALRLCLVALGVGPGDEVIVPSNTYIATWIAVSQCGAIPVPVEPNARTHTIEVDGVEAALTSRTRAVIPVHLYGAPVDLAPLLELARHRSLKVIEDAAQAHGATYNGDPIGAHSDAVAWSFYPGKNLGAMGDAGAVTSNDGDLLDRVRVLRNYGSRVKYVNDVIGDNSRLDPVQAAILRVKLTRLDEWQRRRRQIASVYLTGLEGTSLTLPEPVPYGMHAWHLFVVGHQRRDELRERLLDLGIGTLIHYPIPPHLQGAYAQLGLGRGSLPIAEGLAASVFSLPIGPHVSVSDAETVAATLADLL